MSMAHHEHLNTDAAAARAHDATHPTQHTTVSSYREELRRWHQSAALSETQEKCITELHARRHHLAARALPQHLRGAEDEEDEAAVAPPERDVAAAADAGGSADEADEGAED